MALRVVLAEDNALLRDGMARLIKSQPDLELTGVAADFPELIDLIEREHPDVVVTDIRMPPTSRDEGIRAANQLRETSPATGVVVLSQYANPEYALALLDQGSSGRAYLLKERVTDVEELLRAIREVARGGAVIDSAVIEMLVSAHTQRPTSDLDRLTPREREVLAEMATGKNNATIAASLVLSERAVEKHANAVFAKLGLSEEPDLNRRVKAVLVYLAETGEAAPSRGR
jgi:DNA-binding NarL/FixJ family response regulator